MSEPIRVLQVVTHMNRGGLETMLMNYYREINREEVQFDFLTHRPYDGDYGDEIKELGGRIYHLPRLNPFSATYKKELRRFLRNHPEYHIIHVHQDCLSGVVLREAKRCRIKERIAHSHNANQDKNLKFLVKRVYMRKIPKYATDLFACGNEAGEWMFGGEHFHVLNNAIDSKKYVFDEKKRKEIRNLFGISDDTLVLGHVGRFDTVKNHQFIVDILSELVKKNVRTKVLLVGNDSGTIAEQVKAKIHLLSLDNNVIFTGVRSDVNQLMQAMDVFVFPSLYEGLPVTLVEAQASGLRCVVSDTVSPACAITDMMSLMSLSKGAKYWADEIERFRNYKRKDTHAEIEKAGYDVEKNAKWLESYYLQRY